tara:strand:+ start:258 stop:1007 length:750 start_codon:yes stop_codon:yes gene_type:complete
MDKQILIDGDIICYQIASNIEQPIHWGDDMWTLHSDFNQAKSEFESYINNLKQRLEIKDVKIFLTDGKSNFRELIFPNYKGNRKDKRKPTCLHHMRYWLRDKYNAITEPRLEADDLLGIYATNPDYKGSVVVSADKDLRTIPGKLSNNGVDIEKITQQDAIYNHAYQILIGDSTDNYPGCPGVGPKTAEKLLTDVKGADSMEDYWEIIVNAYKKAGQLEHDALIQGRVSYILNWKDYDFKTKKIKIWKP